ncbi:crossover junction endodeoxyribonuclease RuvC [Mycobacteroides chelonae]|nr:crossover junction endodeoxyribonuclease RuvC [Mycobacteroides chelonae]MEC4869466.1 crossover junction endodeoxyribonuclease RuvC [Mycobacteroides chelonae]
MSTTVLGLDPSLTGTGLAVVRDGVPVALKSIGWGCHEGISYEDRSLRILAVKKAVLTWIDHYGTDTDLVAVEGEIPGGKVTGHYFDRAGLWHHLYPALRRRKMPVIVVNPRTRPKWATGNGGADKKTVQAAVQKWYPRTGIDDHNVADAIVLALMGSVRLEMPVPTMVRARIEDMKKTHQPTRKDGRTVCTSHSPHARWPCSSAAYAYTPTELQRLEAAAWPK